MSRFVFLLALSLCVSFTQQLSLDSHSTEYNYKRGTGYYREGKGFFRQWLRDERKYPNGFCQTRYDQSLPNCCGSRDDDCHVSHDDFQGTVCYCDDFCDRDEPDCCPDYFDVCHSQRPTPSPQKCNSNEFQCTSEFECIDRSRKCDGRADCRDRSDEQGCQPVCQSWEFTCRRQFQCIDAHRKCDGRADCTDNTDEQGCPDKGKIKSSLGPDVVHLANYPPDQMNRSFSCQFEMKHSYDLRLEMYTKPKTIQLETGYLQRRGELEGIMPIRHEELDITAVICRAVNRDGVEKFVITSEIKRDRRQRERLTSSLTAPDYAKCVTVINRSPHTIVATVSYQDDQGNAREMQRTIQSDNQFGFQEVHVTKPGASYSTALPVKRLKVTGVQSELNEVEVPIQVSGVHDCVERKVMLDSSSGGLYITE